MNTHTLVWHPVDGWPPVEVVDEIQSFGMNGVTVRLRGYGDQEHRVAAQHLHVMTPGALAALRVDVIDRVDEFYEHAAMVEYQSHRDASYPVRRDLPDDE